VVQDTGSGKMRKWAFLFPGQGSQKTGMGKDFYNTYESAKEVFETAEKVLPDCSMKSLCFEADDDELRKTENTQPALFTVSYAIYRVLHEQGYKGEIFAGHSLGEYTAVAAAGFLSFEEGLRVVRLRGLLMKDCDPKQRGGMAAIIGTDEETINKVCSEVGDVCPANINSPSQIAISGIKEKVKEAAEQLKEMGVRRTIILNVSGPFHSPSMKDAAVELKKEFEKVEWQQGSGRIVSNVTAKLTENPEEIKDNLIKQLYNPVLWSSSLRTLVDLGYLQHYIESGPGTVLKGLFRATVKEAHVFSVEKPDDIATLKE